MNTRVSSLLLLAAALLLGCAGQRPPSPETVAPAGGADADSPARVPPQAPSPVPLALALAELDQRLAQRPGDHEARLLKALLWFEAGVFDSALAELDPLLREVPGFQLARLIRTDILAARHGPLGRPQASGAPAAEFPEAQLAGLRHEARVRLEAYRRSRPAERVPGALLQLGASTPRAVVVDKRYHRLYLFENPGRDLPPRLVRDVYVSLGSRPGNKWRRGDLRTPEGVYFITGHIPGSTLPPKYGRGAYPLDYPNPVDRRLGKTGHGIWLHGTAPEYYSRPPLDSEGCVVLTNPELDELGSLLTPGTPVVIGEDLRWVDRSEWRVGRDAARRAAARALREEASPTEFSLLAYPASAGEVERLVLAGAGADGRQVRHYLSREEGEWRALEVSRRSAD